MAEYIDRDELLKKQYNASRFSLPQFAEMVVDVQDIEDEPAADVAPVVHGWWISVESDVIFACSECKAKISTSWDYEDDDMFLYCPHCGAKMKNDEEEKQE